MSLLSPPSVRNIELVQSWGEASDGHSFVYRPIDVAGIREVLQIAQEKNLSIALRGAGCSYGDASLNEENIVLDLTQYNQIINWDADQGIIKVESGVTVEQLWQATIEEGWWPPVVSGTMFPTLGGAAAMNIHGKNNFKVGPIGNHILEFELLLADGSLKRCSRKENSDLFHAVIGSFGALGIMTTITMQMKKVYSGYVSVEPIWAKTLAEMFDLFEERLPQSDYLVGWLDCIKGGRSLGRGILHQANYLEPGMDPNSKETLRVGHQGLPGKIMGVFPKDLTYILMGPFVNNWGMRFINMGKYWSERFSLRGRRHLQTHAAFSFLLDYVPNWKWAYKPGGLIQYQLFIPKEKAFETFRRVLQLSQEARLPSYLGVMKRHQPDPFLMTHALDGYSLALDFRVTAKNRKQLWDLAHRMDEVVLNAGGKFYFAKDSTLEKDSIVRFFGKEKCQKFMNLKERYDPENLFQTDLTRRLFDFKEVRVASVPKQAKSG